MLWYCCNIQAGSDYTNTNKQTPCEQLAWVLRHIRLNLAVNVKPPQPPPPVNPPQSLRYLQQSDMLQPQDLPVKSLRNLEAC